MNEYAFVSGSEWALSPDHAVVAPLVLLWLGYTLSCTYYFYGYVGYSKYRWVVFIFFIYVLSKFVFLVIDNIIIIVACISYPI